jgi:hypothetical protein
MQKQRPFTRRQRSRLLKQRLRDERAERKAARVEEKVYKQSLAIFNRCDPERTERLADGT